MEQQSKKSIFKLWWFWILVFFGTVAFAFFNLMFWGNFGHWLKDTDVSNPPIFVTHDFVDLDKVDSITKFRSGIGHDSSGNGETCRSMRHYYGHAAVSNKLENGDKKQELFGSPPNPGDPQIAIYAPADGWIMGISGEDTAIGKQLQFKPDNAKGYTIRLDHLYPVDGIRMLKRVKGGQLIGKIHDGQTVDIGVYYLYRGDPRYVSYFQVMTDEVFAEYKAKGLNSRSEAIIPKEVVDANPWKCDGGEEGTLSFAEDYANTPDGEKLNYIHLNGYVPEVDTKKTEDDSKNNLGSTPEGTPRIPSKICPDSEKAGQGDGAVYLNGKPYYTEGEDWDWIVKNCPDYAKYAE